jgi:hypothetical protein
MLLLKSPQNFQEAMHQRDFLAMTLAEVLVGQGYVEENETLDGQSLIGRAKHLAARSRKCIDLAQPGPYSGQGIFQGKIYDAASVFPVLVILFSSATGWRSSSFGWCPVDAGQSHRDASISHARLAEFNDGRIPGTNAGDDGIDESLDVFLLNLDNDFSCGRGFPAIIKARTDLPSMRVTNKPITA